MIEKSPQQHGGLVCHRTWFTPLSKLNPHTENTHVNTQEQLA
jgi:hypothetical protein